MIDEAVLAGEMRSRHGVTTRRRLRRLGLTDRVIDGLVTRGRLRLAGNGVLVDAASPSTFEQAVGVACAATGGVASFPTAGLIWGLRRTPRTADVHVTIPWRRRSTAPPGVVVHRSTCLPPGHVVRRADGIDVTSPPRTVFDAAGFVAATAVESMIEQGLDRQMFTLPTLWAVCRTLLHSARAGSFVFAGVLASRDAWVKPVRSEYELILERAMRRRGFPPLVREHPIEIGPGKVVHPDLGVPADGFFVEVDHLTWHGGRVESAYDRWRDMKVRMTGVHVERVTDVAIRSALDETVDDLWTLWQRHRGRIATAAVANLPRVKAPRGGSLTGLTLADHLPPAASDPVDVVDAFGSWAASGGRPLYPHQEEAALALAAGDHVVLATPTGSGKSLVATAGIVLALDRGERAVWTAPIKALVAEKFFELVGLLGAERVGLATGDAAINTAAPVLVCTAEVLANQALGSGAATDVGFACLDEFHYYADRDRGWAWQVPLLELRNCQFLLASATLGDVSAITEDLGARSGRSVTAVTSVHRPTPLYHQWRMTAVADSVTEAVREGLSPVYVVHGTQATAIERAQALVSLPLTTRLQREAIAAAVASAKLHTGFGRTLGRLLANGVGVHHAGMLPRHRRLVERLAGEGLLPVICGTDTLGVGVNIPIRTVLMTALTKFDGSRVRVFTAREFHQLAGRAGRPGFDPDGHVWAQAPEHVIENAKALAKAGDDPKARRKAVKAKPPAHFVHYDEMTFDRLVAASPEPLTSRFRVTADLVATVLGRPDGPTALKALLAGNHDPPERRRWHQRRAIAVYRSLEAAGVAERLRDDTGRCLGVRIGSRSGDDAMPGLDWTNDRVRLSSPLAPFAIEVVATLDADDPQYVVDVLSVVEAAMEDPRQVLNAQQDAARSAAMARMKADGVEYEERIERLESITWPRPLVELIDACFATYQANHPWIDVAPAPKSVVREMLESGDTFATFVRRYRLDRSEGLVLRYISDVWRTLEGTLPPAAVTPMLEDVIEWLGAMIRATDATLLEEWELLSRGEAAERIGQAAPVIGPVGPPPAWRTAVRTAAFGWVELLAARSDDVLAARSGWSADRLGLAMAPYWSTYDAVGIDGDARSAAYFDLRHEPVPGGPGRWVITQRLADPAGDGEWRFVATVDLASALDEGAPSLVLESLGPFG